MNYKYDNIVFIGRFQPFHNAHLSTIRHALSLAQRVIIVIGSANQPRDDANPFTQDEREHMIRESLKEDGYDLRAHAHKDRVRFAYVENTIYNDAQWASSVTKAVETNMLESIGNNTTSVSLIGHTKDESSFYLKMFPQWGSPIEMELVEKLDATTIRDMYFSDKNNLNFFRSVVPNAVVSFLRNFQLAPEYEYIKQEAEYIRKYRKQFEHLPYPPTFMTGDCVVFKDNHVILIERRAAPGKGLLALPGGFLNANSDANVMEAAIRELYEETKIKVPEKIIRKSIVEEKIFSAKNRSRRGRVITVAQFIVLDDPDNPGLPKLKGSDDATRAVWHPLHKLNRIELFEDHYDVISWFAGRYGNRSS